jgi:hypothetical protein
MLSRKQRVSDVTDTHHGTQASLVQERAVQAALAQADSLHPLCHLVLAVWTRASSLRDFILARVRVESNCS